MNRAASTLTWIDLTASDRDRMRQVLDLFEEKGTVDEMGLGRLRDAISDALFPGTSTIQTRLRYVLFVPWIYQRLEVKRVASSQISEQLRKAELELIGPLLKHGASQGVIGERARGSLARLPSSVYWTALVRWGLFMHQRPQGWYHENFSDLLRGPAQDDTADDPGVVSASNSNWHPRLPDPPPTFPDQVSFDLAKEEAEFLQGRIEERCADSLLAWFAGEGIEASADGSFWDDSTAGNAPIKLRDTIELARRFSRHVEGMPLLYNLMLAERSHSAHGGDDAHMDMYKQKIDEWAAKEAAESRFVPAKLWTFAASRSVNIPSRLRVFVEAWTSELSKLGPASIAENQKLQNLIESREHQLKGPRARLNNPARLLDWNGKVGVGVGRMNFRWHRARQMLLDLHAGLAN